MININKSRANIIVFIFLLFLIPYDSVIAAGDNTELKISIDGHKVDFMDGLPFINSLNNCVYVPMDFFQDDKIQAQATWVEDLNHVSFLSRDGIVSSFFIGNEDYSYFELGTDYRAIVRKKSIAVPILVEGKPYLPLRVVVETFGINVRWDGINKEVILETSDEFRDSLETGKEWRELLEFIESNPVIYGNVE
ncbi:stalk domain-containing protein [Paenibacillus fonticola]|uniref:stalk domain-containing protein n=1 Tax=Paenibacillus fonticola TaxID=379896 RepID=UPI00037A652B|nr:stalk domain-containing protein [Paenibacillus fonticola]